MNVWKDVKWNKWENESESTCKVYLKDVILKLPFHINRELQYHM